MTDRKKTEVDLETVTTPPVTPVKLHDQVETWINEGGAGDEDPAKSKTKPTTPGPRPDRKPAKTT